jgi:DNA-binding NarL/FixJ family response regulator
MTHARRRTFRDPPSAHEALIKAIATPVRILLVDAREHVRLEVARFLTQFNVEVFEAVDIGQAVEQAELHTPDIIFVNLRIPLPSDGATVIRELKRLQPDVPVVAYAADLNGEVGEAIRSVAEEGIVPVPTTVALAQEFIHRILKTFKLSRRAGMEA